MPLLDDMGSVNYGDLPIRIMYREGVEVWPKISVALAATPVAWDTIALTITPPIIPVDSYVIKRNGTQIYAGTDLTFTDPAKLNPSMTYTYTVDAIKAGTVWASATSTPTTPARADLGLVATATSHTAMNVTWSDPSGGSIDEYFLQRTGTPGVYLPATTKSYPDSGLTASTPYTYNLQARRAGTIIQPTDTTSATTPPNPTAARQATISCVSSTSYSGVANNHQYIADNTNRQDPRGWLFAGQYVYSNGTNFFGHQKAYWTFNVPADVRNCISIQSIYISVWMEDIPLQNPSGSNFSLFVHHGAFQGGYPTTPPPGHTNSFLTLHSMDQNWLGMKEWVEISNYVCPGRTTVKEEFRVNGAQGFVMKGLTNDPSDYGFALGGSDARRPRVQFNYTVYTE